MAEQQHLEIIRQGPEVWNRWRIENPRVRPDFSGADLSGADLRRANLSGADLRGADLESARLQEARCENAVFTGARLWELQRARWVIKGVICEHAYWDRDRSKATHYQPGEFERLYAEQPCIELFYEGGMTRFELNTMPALLHHLNRLHPTSEIRLKRVEETAGGAKITITVAAAEDTFMDIEVLAQKLHEAQTALRDEAKRAERLEIEKLILRDEVIPLLLERTAPFVYIGGNATGTAIASPNSSLIVNDTAAVYSVLKKIETRRSALALTNESGQLLDAAIRDLQAELRKSRPRHPTIVGGLRVVCGLVAAATANAFGTAVATNQWQPMLEELKRLISLFGG